MANLEHYGTIDNEHVIYSNIPIRKVDIETNQETFIFRTAVARNGEQYFIESPKYWNHIIYKHVNDDDTAYDKDGNIIIIYKKGEKIKIDFD